MRRLHARSWLPGAFVYPGFIDALSDRFLTPAPDTKAPEPTDTDSAAMFADVRAASFRARVR
jgi:hypothetical protein